MLSVNKFPVKLQNFLNLILRRRFNEVKNFVCENVSSCSLCQVENERISRNCLSKSENLSTRTNLKTNFKNLSKNSVLSKCETLSDPQERGQKG
jgi:hypothetical protein